MSIDVAAIRRHFPLLSRMVNGRDMVYLDSANSSQKPQAVIDAMSNFMATSYAPVSRSSYLLATESTDAYEGARAKVAAFINAPSANEVVFTKNATEALNLVAYAWGRKHLKRGDVVVLTHMEHHSNIVPWQILAGELDLQLRWVPITADGHLDLETVPQLLDGAKVFSFTAMSNVLGTLTPVRALTDAAHAAGAIAVVDGCQYVPHNVTDVVEMGADFMAFSSHKMCGPTGIGVLWGHAEMLDATPPFLGGGSMIDDVTLDGFITAPIPLKFEAGTPPIIEAVGLGAAVDYLSGIGMRNIRNHEMSLTRYALDTLHARFGDDIVIYGPDNIELRGATLSFKFRDVHPHDVSQILDDKNVYVRAGHHCAKPLMRILGAGATARASFYLYNDESEVDLLCDALDSVTDIFG